MNQGPQYFHKNINYLCALTVALLGWSSQAVGLEVFTKSKDAQEMSALIEKYEKDSNIVAEEDGEELEEVARDLVAPEPTRPQPSSGRDEPFDDIDFSRGNPSSEASKQATEISDDEIRIEVESVERAETAAWN